MEASKAESTLTEFIQKMVDENGGGITAEQIVEAAKDVNSPLHKEFQWDDSVAAHQYRLHQARTMLAKFKLIVRVDNNAAHNKIRQFTYVKPEHRYVPTLSLLNKTGNEKMIAQKLLDQVQSLINNNKFYFELYPNLRKAEPQFAKLALILKIITEA